MQASPLYQDMVSKIDQLQILVNNLVAANNQTTAYLGTQLVPSATIAALQAAMVTLQGNSATFKTTIPAVVAGN